jgi:hypothetical protein
MRKDRFDPADNVRLAKTEYMFYNEWNSIFRKDVFPC